MRRTERTEQPDDILAGETLWKHKSALACFADRDRTYPAYLRSLWKGTAAFGWYSTGLAVFRKLRFLRTLWRVIQTIWIAIQTGTLILILLPVLLILFPGFLLLTAVMTVGGLLEMRHKVRKMEEILRGKRVFLVWPDSEVFEKEKDRFMLGQIREWAAMPDTVVLVRSPFSFSSRGLGGQGFYWTVRQESARVYLLRTQAFFPVRRVAEKSAAEVIAWY